MVKKVLSKDCWKKYVNLAKRGIIANNLDSIVYSSNPILNSGKYAFQGSMTNYMSSSLNNGYLTVTENDVEGMFCIARDIRNTDFICKGLYHEGLLLLLGSNSFSTELLYMVQYEKNRFFGEWREVREKPCPYEDRNKSAINYLNSSFEDDFDFLTQNRVNGRVGLELTEVLE